MWSLKAAVKSQLYITRSQPISIAISSVTFLLNQEILSKVNINNI